jgi:hypothetical protein
MTKRIKAQISRFLFLIGLMTSGFYLDAKNSTREQDDPLDTEMTKMASDMGRLFGIQDLTLYDGPALDESFVNWLGPKIRREDVIAKQIISTATLKITISEKGQSIDFERDCEDGRIIVVVFMLTYDKDDHLLGAKDVVEIGRSKRA